jgi:murein DD-endopeptidase MepM/ murein hydrolase activator NlpD
VEAGQLLGSVGDTAMIEIAEEPHLHVEMTVKGIQVDPLEYFSKDVLSAITEDSIYETETDK